MLTRTIHRSRIADDYLELVQRFPLVPIKGRRHLKEAFRVIDALSIINEETLTRGQADYLIVLSGLVERYEDDVEASIVPFSSGLDALKYLLDQHSMSASDLGRLLGNRQLGASILR